MKLNIKGTSRHANNRVGQLCNMVFLHTKAGQELLELLIEENLLAMNDIPTDNLTKYDTAYAAGLVAGHKNCIREIYRAAMSYVENTEVKEYE